MALSISKPVAYIEQQLSGMWGAEHFSVSTTIQSSNIFILDAKSVQQPLQPLLPVAVIGFQRLVR